MMRMEIIKRLYTAINKAILSLSSGWHWPMVLITGLAGPVFVSLSGIAFALIGWFTKKPIVFKLALLILATFLVVTILKHIFRKARPDTDYARNLRFSKYSFPSGHAAVGSVLWYGMVLVLSNLGLSAGLVMAMTFLAPILVLMIGVSRVYLGAHYLVDVLVGWVLGLMMVGIFIVTSMI